MNRKKLMALLKRKQAKLNKLDTRMKKGEVREEDLDAVQDEVEELIADIEELAEVVETLEEDVLAAEEDIEVIEEDLDGDEPAAEEKSKRAKNKKGAKRTKRKKRIREDGATLEDLQDEIADLVDEVQELVDAVEAVEEDVDVIEDDIDVIEGEIVDEARGNRRRGRASSQQRSAASTAIRNGLSSRNAKSSQKRDAEVRSAFANFVVGKISEAEARSLGIDAGNGSVTVPTVIAAEIITYAQEENLLRKYGTHHTTTTNMQFPVLVKKAVANVSKKERTTNMPETEIEFDEIMLTPVEFDALATVTKKLIRMSGVNIEDVVVDELKKAYVEKETSYMFKGDDVGNENPGSLAKKSVPYYESTPIDLDADGWSQKLYSQLVKFKGQPVTAVLRKAMWIVNRAALTVLEDMTDANGRPLLHEATDGIGYKFLGHSLEFTDAVDGTDRTVPVFYFGDFSAFHIQDVEGELGIQRLIEAYAAQNKIGFQIYNILDGQLIYSPMEPAVYRYEVGATA